jgi:hypothetical protein
LMPDIVRRVDGSSHWFSPIGRPADEYIAADLSPIGDGRFAKLRTRS